MAGPSRATVSRAVNGDLRVSPEAQAAVDDAVRTLGYTPHRAARSRVTRRTDSIAVLVPESHSMVFCDQVFAGTRRRRAGGACLGLSRSGVERARGGPSSTPTGRGRC